MAVIINELEVVVDSPPEPAAAPDASPQTSEAPPPKLRPLDLSDITERHARIWSVTSDV